MVKELTCHEAMDLPPVSFNQHASSVSLYSTAISQPRYIFIFLESACHDKQNGDQIFKIGARIAELWQFKARKLQEEDHLAIFKPGLWQTGFFGCGEEWYHFQQELMVNKMIVKLFS